VVDDFLVEAFFTVLFLAEDALDLEEDAFDLEEDAFFADVALALLAPLPALFFAAARFAAARLAAAALRRAAALDARRVRSGRFQS
jgi:hypothetical protein